MNDKDIAVESGIENNELAKSLKFKLDGGVESGSYHITANAYSSDGKLRDSKTAEINVQDCAPAVEESAGEEEVVFIANAGQQNKVQTAKKTIEAPKEGTLSHESNNAGELILLSTSILGVFFVLAVIVLL